MTLLSSVKFKWKIFSNFVAFSEYPTLIEKMGHLDYLASHNSAKTIMKFHLTFYEPTISLNISEVFIEDQDLTEFFSSLNTVCKT